MSKQLSETFQPVKVNCPSCGKQVAWTTKNTHRPFCSDRCRLIDLGEWASECYKIPDSTAESET